MSASPKLVVTVSAVAAAITIVAAAVVAKDLILEQWNLRRERAEKAAQQKDLRDLESVRFEVRPFRWERPSP